ncbi:MAG: TonB-dependent receptor [Epsilonproteobacteria bacterium]|nr:TonB-dependent receptor [Campylobacterota bacterium]
MRRTGYVLWAAWLTGAWLYGAEISADQDISQLLARYKDVKELYHKTKVESAGLLTLYTRSDLEKMQIYHLKDILKSLRFFNYQEGYVGESALSPSGGRSVVSPFFRLYIDDHEISSAIYGSAMLQFGQMDLGFVDHIEIYEGGNAVAFGNEPGLVTIRLYSKEAANERGNGVGVCGDTRGSVTGRGLVTALSKDERSALMLYATASRERREKVKTRQRRYSKDSHGGSFYGTYAFGKRVWVRAGYFRKRQDAFVGVGLYHRPEDPNEVENDHAFIAATFRLPSRFVLKLSADRSRNEMTFSDEDGIRIVQSDGELFHRFDGRFDEAVLKAQLNRRHRHEKGEFFWGIEAIRKSYDVVRMRMDRTYYREQTGPDRLFIFSLFAEERYHIDPWNLLIGTLKADRYSDNDRSGTRYEKIARVGYIHLFSKKWKLKLFASRTYLYPGFAYTSTFPNLFYANPRLGAEHHDMGIGELGYDGTHGYGSVGFAYNRTMDHIRIDPYRLTFVNDTKDYTGMRYFIKAGYRFDALNRVEAEWYLTDPMSGGMEVRSSLRGGYVRCINTVGAFDFFNELVYRSGYTYPLPDFLGGAIGIDPGYDWSAGVRWHLNHALTLSLKGENILDKAVKTPIFGVGGVNAVDRRFLVNMEYFF